MKKCTMCGKTAETKVISNMNLCRQCMFDLLEQLDKALLEDRLRAGDKGWWVNADDDWTIEPAVVSGEPVYDTKGNLDSFSLDFQESKDFDVFDGSALGKWFFLSEKEALERLDKIAMGSDC